MKRFFRSKSMLSLVLVLSLLFSMATPAFEANAAQSSNGYYFEKVDNSAVKGTKVDSDRVVKDGASATLKATDEVRVSIVLEGSSVIDEGFSTEDLAANQEALSFITKAKAMQKTMEKKIAAAITGELKVQWNLTIAANIISADVNYGDLEAIAGVKGVKKVVLETKYEAYSPTASDDTNMTIASNIMTGAQQAWIKGQTGAGARIAIIDTGLDIDHQSFNNNAFLYALEQDAIAAGYSKNTKRYIKSLRLLDVNEIASVLEYLNAYKDLEGQLTAEELVVSEKIPFAFNYVDTDLDVRHINDEQGEHGSHVAGIAAANRYLENADGTFADALSTVLAAGNAPDAQLIVMKVFGKKGGAFDSDYMAAIEDAILLGADSVNLSLGSAAAGFSYNTTYQEILDKLTKTDTVVVMSAGNSGKWSDETYYGYLYADDVNSDTAGSPGSYTNSLSVASVNNAGAVSNVFEIAGTYYSFTESTAYGNTKLIGLADGAESAELEYVFIDGIGKEEDYEGIDVAGKVVFVSRGETSFFEKANIAVAHGAVATIIYNNTDGVIGLNLTGYKYTAPCVSILLSDAEKIKAASTETSVDEERTYYTGKITILSKPVPILSTDTTYTMSSFSSWGVPGNLSLKPEITAPGGNIWSVNGTNNEGGGTDQYELMSGTSMAAPQITGMTAVLKRYLETTREKWIPKMSYRALAQSLLMSTATPMVDADGSLYPVFQQGAGLANVYDAMKAASFIMMDENATVSAADGKVKAELGDDPDRTGVYSFSFTIQNLTGKTHSYDLNEAIFTQLTDGVFSYDSTGLLGAKVTYYVNGQDVSSVAPVNPYLEQVDAAQAEFDKAVAAYNEAVDAVLVATAAASESNQAVIAAKAELAKAQANLVAAQTNERLARATKNVGKIGKARYEAAVKRLNEAKAAVAVAEKNLKTANAVAANGNKVIQTAVKAQTKAAAAVTKAEAKLAAAELLKNSWVAPYELNTVTLGMFSSAKVDVVIELSDRTKAVLDYYYENGAYIEGYIFLDSKDETSSHSIPVLAYYGDWSDPSMFDKGSYVEYKYGLENRPPYLYAVNKIYGNTFSVDSEGDEYYMGTNLYATEKNYNQEFNALSSRNGDSVKKVYYSLIRNAEKIAVEIKNTETGEVYYSKDLGSQYAAFFHASSNAWKYAGSSIGLDWKGTDAVGNALPDGTKVEIALYAVTEYHADVTDYATLGDGAKFAIELTIDNEAPELEKVEDAAEGIAISATDNHGIAAVVIYSNDGAEEIARTAVGGTETTVDFTEEKFEAGVYLVSVIDYAGNSSTYRLFYGVEPTTEVEGIQISNDAITLIKNNSLKLFASVAPVTLFDRSVIWTSSDETVATVAADGTVTAVGVGACTVTATAVADSEKSASCEVEVIEITYELNGVVWDEKGQVWFSEINTANLPSYKTLAQATDNAPINGLVYGADGTLYATDLDTENGVSNLYTVDQSTLELTLVGASSVAYTDIAEAPSLGGFMATYFNYLVLVDPTTGDYIGAFNYLSDGELVGITYLGSAYNKNYGTYLDMYYLMDSDGNLYFEAFIELGGKYYYFNGAEEALIGGTGIKSDTPYFQSLYFNGEYTFFANFNESSNDVALYAIDTEVTGKLFLLGRFDEGVWPVAGLTEFSAGVTEASGDATEALATAKVKAEATASINK